MAAYTDWAFYSTEYLGTQIAEAAFSALALRASAVLDNITFGRVAAIITADEETDLIEKIQSAVCAVAETLQLQMAGEKEISSESVGGHSVSYVVSKDMEQTNLRKLQMSAKLYLGNTGLMFRGFASDEYGTAVDED